MNRFNRRLSRLLIVILVLAVGLGAFSYFHKAAGSGDHTTAATTTPPPPTTLPSMPRVVIQREEEHQRTVAVVDPATRPATVRPATVRSAHESIAQLAAVRSTTEPASGASILSEAQAKIDAGNFVEAREQLNDALKSASLSESDVTAVKAMIALVSKTVVFGKQRFNNDPYSGSYVVKSGDSLAKIANTCDCTWDLIGQINGIDAAHLRAGATIKIIQGPFFAVVDKKKFAIDLYLGGLPSDNNSMYVTTYPVGLGRDDSTPTGTWMVEPHHKLKHPTYYSPRGEGVIAADDPKNPLGGFWIGLTGTEGQAVGRLSYGIHGTIDPDSIGKQSSMGCIRLRHDDIVMVYQMLVEGKSMVVVKE